MDDQGLTIGEVAEATGLSVHALRFFEREGLFLRDIPRTAAGRRVFAPADVEWLTLMNRLRDSGMPIAGIRGFAALVAAGPGNEAERLKLLKQHEADVRAKIAELEACLEVVHHKVVVYERHVEAGTARGLWSPQGRAA
ncbi:DNA-binding transcriptional regulator, MerR family [Glycomyces sambucus]|uniref:DNA-binding transcriptional regulator, MerR family n=1 Tax=Glycomyces sambucus TaxID=380244 RepID=A0A1G9F166_9ACTN|nr:MerR family transcriptional regulator [Glycomyces sambucus]SDK82098.1 DNA-binding transcriptional regulator, MerR family [Glycomyces sambucus]